MSKIINFPKNHESTHSQPEAPNPLDDSYTETSWDSLASAVPFDADSPNTNNVHSHESLSENDPDTNDDLKDNAEDESELPSDFDDIANMLIHDSTTDFEQDPDNAPQKPETILDHEQETAIAGNFLSHLEIQLDQAKKPGERQELTELISIGEDYYGYALDEEENRTSAEILQHLENKYNRLSKLYQRESRQYLASKYANRAKLVQNKFTDYYEHFASTHGRDQTPKDTNSTPSTEFSPDALPSDLIV